MRGTYNGTGGVHAYLCVKWIYKNTKIILTSFMGSYN